MHPRRLFGELCVEMGLATDEGVRKALATQEQLKIDGNPHKMIGIIMLDQGVLDTTTLIDVVQEMDRRVKLTEM